ncbi:MAG: DUF1566 domain-containing protein [Candidatus Nitrotoga sp.]|jgi:Protein of unknown function (DUF1566)|nr:DUF1566 domain-containing protein [Candidatus Nitrotoga sp.]MDW7626144.1 DUF1566 domain-containing protein [Candidatus Nitrotoga sp.]
MQIETRYTLSEDGSEVTDTKTQLIWRRYPEGMMANNVGHTGTPTAHTWDHALTLANDVALTSSKAWRLPTVKELSSIVDANFTNPAIDTHIFPGTSTTPFWSASPVDGNPSKAWYVMFYGGFMNTYVCGGKLQVRLVRSN